MSKSRIHSLDVARPLLMLGVVLIHSSLLLEIPDSERFSWVGYLMKFISSGICGGCVPAFFVISGFLFFRSGNRTFTPNIYLAKIKSRVKTLLVPYLLWNLIASGVFLIKVFLFGYPGFNVVRDGHIDFLQYLYGFWSITEDFPFDFPLWFLRNLIVFVVISPVVYLIAERTWLTCLMVVFLLFPSVYSGGALYFMLGAWCYLHLFKLSNNILGFFTVILIITAVSLTFWDSHMNTILNQIIVFLRNIGLVAGVVFIGRIIYRRSVRIPARLPGMIFFIFALHGIYCTLVRTSLYKIGGHSEFGVLLTYVLTFVALLLSSGLFYIIIQRYFPKCASVLSGNRG